MNKFLFSTLVWFLSSHAFSGNVDSKLERYEIGANWERIRLQLGLPDYCDTDGEITENRHHIQAIPGADSGVVVDDGDRDVYQIVLNGGFDEHLENFRSYALRVSFDRARDQSGMMICGFEGFLLDLDTGKLLEAMAFNYDGTLLKFVPTELARDKNNEKFNVASPFRTAHEVISQGDGCLECHPRVSIEYDTAGNAEFWGNAHSLKVGSLVAEVDRISLQKFVLDEKAYSIASIRRDKNKLTSTRVASAAQVAVFEQLEAIERQKPENAKLRYWFSLRDDSAKEFLQGVKNTAKSFAGFFQFARELKVLSTRVFLGGDEPRVVVNEAEEYLTMEELAIDLDGKYLIDDYSDNIKSRVFWEQKYGIHVSVTHLGANKFLDPMLESIPNTCNDCVGERDDSLVVTHWYRGYIRVDCETYENMCIFERDMGNSGNFPTLKLDPGSNNRFWSEYRKELL